MPGFLKPQSEDKWAQVRLRNIHSAIHSAEQNEALLPQRVQIERFDLSQSVHGYSPRLDGAVTVAVNFVGETADVPENERRALSDRYCRSDWPHW
jgi:hypothetical protein